ncbi:YsnF/AvaK domain-containing protein [Pontibacter liquoris]|uniref:YsnF/AvaK domain-containing protein n=1 Tax=Pontibacter liquoris TaxID=2905677 RepID=UPI001FA7719B|nr:YsnF/AvaK domain-containing protein [Pontibacter liquoris]
MEKQTVIGIFDYGVDAQVAAQELMQHGIPSDHIDLTVNGLRDRNENRMAPPAAAPDRPVENARGTENFFGSLFDDRDESQKYAEVAEHGSILTVHAESREQAKKAAELLDKCGAIDVNDRAEKYRSMPQEKRGNWINSNNAIPIVEEKMKVGKREVETGGVHIRSRIVERPVEERLRLRQEHIDVERRPVNRPANERDLENFKEGEITMTEHAEVPVVNKEARVVEEVRLNKTTEERQETVRGTERKQDVEIDKLHDRDRLNDPRRGPENV